MMQQTCTGGAQGNVRRARSLTSFQHAQQSGLQQEPSKSVMHAADSILGPNLSKHPAASM